MPYRFLDDIAIADIAFEAWGDTVENMFIASAEATMNVMVDDLDTIERKENRTTYIEAEALDMLLFHALQELIYYKDAEQLLLRVSSIRIQHKNGKYVLNMETYGEKIDADRHDLLADVKAVTLHHFQVEKTPEGWKATVVLDV